MSLVSVAELRQALGIGALYDDADLQECLDAADNLILDMLVQNIVGVETWSVTSNVATLTTIRPHGFIVGQTVIVNGVHAQLNGSNTITVVPNEYSLKFAVTHANQATIRLVPLGTVGQSVDYSTTPEVLEAALMTAADIYQARFATNGQSTGIDFQAGPYKMGRSLMSRVQGLLAAHIALGTMVG